MATLLIIASLALNLALVSVISLMANSFTDTINHRDRSLLNAFNKLDFLHKKHRPIKRNIKGRIGFSDYEIEQIRKDFISNVKPESHGSYLAAKIIERVSESIAVAIVEELKSNPQYIDVTFFRIETDNIFVADFSFNLLLASNADQINKVFQKFWNDVHDQIEKPRIINTHY